MGSRGNSWMNQRAFARSRVDYQIAGMSLRTQEACAAVRQNREPDYNRVDITAEDVTYAINGRKADKLHRLILTKPVWLEWGSVSIQIQVKCSDGTFFTRTINADADLIAWAQPIYTAALAEYYARKAQEQGA